MATDWVAAKIKDINVSPGETLYTVPGSTVSAVNGIKCTNTSASNKTFNMWVTSGGTDYQIAEDVVLEAGETYDFDGVIILEAADVIKVQSSADPGLDVWASIVERT